MLIYCIDSKMILHEYPIDVDFQDIEECHLRHLDRMVAKMWPQLVLFSKRDAISESFTALPIGSSNSPRELLSVTYALQIPAELMKAIFYMRKTVWTKLNLQDFLSSSKDRCSQLNTFVIQLF